MCVWYGHTCGNYDVYFKGVQYVTTIQPATHFYPVRKALLISVKFDGQQPLQHNYQICRWSMIQEYKNNL